MTTDLLVEVTHWFGTICLIASLAIRVLPTPEEIPARAYRVLYNTIRRFSLNAAWQVGRNGNGPKP